VTVCSRPKGFPMAMTHSPTLTSSELPNWILGRLPSDLIFDEGQVRVGVPPFDFRIKLTLVLEDHLDFISALHHVIVGDDEAGLVNDEPGAQTPLFKSLVWTAPEKLLKKIVERVIFIKWSPPETWICCCAAFCRFFSERMLTTAGLYFSASSEKLSGTHRTWP